MHKLDPLNTDAKPYVQADLAQAQVLVVAQAQDRFYLAALVLTQYKACFEFGLRWSCFKL